MEGLQNQRMDGYMDALCKLALQFSGPMVNVLYGFRDLATYSPPHAVYYLLSAKSSLLFEQGK